MKRQAAVKADEQPEGVMECSFCKKTPQQIRKLIAGPGVFICDECVEVCVDIIAGPGAGLREEEGSVASGKSPLLTASCSLCRSPAVVEELLPLEGRGAICKPCVWAVRNMSIQEEGPNGSPAQ